MFIFRVNLVSIVKAHTIKWQIYPDEVFYAKDLLPTRVTTSFDSFCILTLDQKHLIKETYISNTIFVKTYRSNND